ncbi:hypothetical protein T069G_01746 [Trichoderma breve]|uniref:Transcription factor RfeG n=1 Tax=Trichoderma breve TaxID=2034170 RepID=A0A9W9JSD3_9HYPO|nr:hypothetical protein T069G_01746 [Trichoderma breve]KAJ4865216.1 hypothetical protein T069G_01746 [Trichoderma breve]
MSRPTTRMNEYFVPRDGIDREVISADICRYLGNDALVRPGHYENPQTGQPVQGYYITAYRNLTTAMIEDLKADSARWDRERRAQTARNSSGVQYRYSETHQSRQHHGPTEPPFRDDSYPPRDGLYDAPRYPGTGAQGYNGASGPYQPQQQQQGYAPPSGGAYVGNPQGGPMMNQGYQNPDGPYVSTGANMPPRNYPNDPYAGGHPGASVPPPQQPVYASTQPVQPGYPAPAYPYPNQAPSGAPVYATQPQDPFFGRASPAGQTSQQPQGYASQGHAYDETPPPTRTSVPPAETQTPPRESSTRLSDREGDRNHRPPPPRR